MDLTVDLYATRTAWLRARRDPLAIGASEAAAALGVSPYMTPWDLYELKQGQRGEPRTPEDARILARGNRWEPVVLAEYEDASEGRIVSPGVHFGATREHLVTVANRAFPWLRESPDAFAVDRHGELGHVEAKTAMDRDAWASDAGLVIEEWTDECAELVPPHYAVQGYAQLAVTGLPWNDLCALVPADGWLAVRWVRLLRDEETQGQIVEALAAWRSRHLVGGEPPPVDGTTACNRYLARKFPAFEDPRPVRVAEPAEAAALQELVALRAQMKRAEERAKELANGLAAVAGAHRIALAATKGSPYGQAQMSAGRTTIDSEKLQADFPDAYAACKRTGAPSVSFNLYRFKEP